MSTYQLRDLDRYRNLQQDVSMRAFVDPWFWLSALLTVGLLTLVCAGLGLPRWVAIIATAVLYTFLISGGVTWTLRKIGVWRRMRVHRRALRESKKKF